VAEFHEQEVAPCQNTAQTGHGVLIVTIDEHEVHHLGMLLEQIFPESYRQMVTIVVNPKGVTQGRFSRVEEYALFCFMKGAFVTGRIDDLLTPDQEKYGGTKKGPRWKGLLRSGTNARRTDRKRMFFPVLVDPERGAVLDVGEPLPIDRRPNLNKKINGLSAAWPIRSDLSEGNWGVGHETLKKLIEKGYVALGRFDKKRQTYGISYLGEKLRDQIDAGSVTITNYDKPRNVVTVEYVNEAERQIKSVWHRTTHDAGAYGSDVLKNLLGKSGMFSFPKSIYAVRDTLSAITKNNPDAVIVDFFAGSGTTLHSTCLLNAEDGGHRQCVLVTNNEVSDEESKAFIKKGLQPGDAEWEKAGICRSVTWPRVRAAVTGKREDGAAVEGEYQLNRFVMAESRRSIKHVGFTDGRVLSASQKRQLVSLIPGVPQSKIDTNSPWLLEEDISSSILWDIASAQKWLMALEEAEHVTDLYVVTHEDRDFKDLEAKIEQFLPPIFIQERDKRIATAGLAANVTFLKLDFLDPNEVQLGKQFAAILPILWMIAGARGKRPAPPTKGAAWLLPEDCHFAVLMREDKFKEFHRRVATRGDLSHVFIVTNSTDTYIKLKDELSVPQVIQLYRDYLDNFKINIAQDRV
jgi:adenine-specific DNA-methyltransferase